MSKRAKWNSLITVGVGEQRLEVGSGRAGRRRGLANRTIWHSPSPGHSWTRHSRSRTGSQAHGFGIDGDLGRARDRPADRLGEARWSSACLDGRFEHCRLKPPFAAFGKEPALCAAVSTRRIVDEMVPRRRLELPRLSPLAPETCASTNSATWAKRPRGSAGRAARRLCPAAQVNPHLAARRAAFQSRFACHIPSAKSIGPRDGSGHGAALGHGFRRVRLRRPPCGARLARDGWLVRVAVRHPDEAPFLKPLATSARSSRSPPTSATAPRSRRRRGRRRGDQPGRHPVRGRQQTFQAVHVEGSRTHRRGAARAGVPAPRPDLGHRRRRRSPPRLRPLQGRGRGGGAAGLARSHDHPPVDRVRAGGRLLQPLRRMARCPRPCR